MSCLIAQEPRNKCIRHDLAYLGDLSFVKWLSLCSGRASRIKYDDLARGAMTDGMNYFIVSFLCVFTSAIRTVKCGILITCFLGCLLKEFSSLVWHRTRVHIARQGWTPLRLAQGRFPRTTGTLLLCCWYWKCFWTRCCRSSLPSLSVCWS